MNQMKQEVAKKSESPKKISLRVLDGQTELAEEELEKLFAFFSKWSREVLTAVAIAIVAFFAFKFFKEADTRQQKASAQKFSEVRDTYNDFTAAYLAKEKATGDDVKKEEAKITEAKNKLTEQLKVLNDSREPYKNLATLYNALMLQRSGDIEGVKGLIPTLKIEEALAKPDSENLSVELSAVALARTMLDTDTTYQDGWNLLATLAAKGQYVQVQAFKSLQTLASSEAEKKQVEDLRKQITEKRPEIVELLPAG